VQNLWGWLFDFCALKLAQIGIRNVGFLLNFSKTQTEAIAGFPQQSGKRFQITVHVPTILRALAMSSGRFQSSLLLSQITAQIGHSELTSPL
jgi:hypothetical protein